MILTRELIMAAGLKNDGGTAFNNAQIKMFGGEIPATQGWIDRLIGKSIPEEDYAKACALRGVRKKLERRAILNDQLGLI